MIGIQLDLELNQQRIHSRYCSLQRVDYCCKCMHFLHCIHFEQKLRGHPLHWRHMFLRDWKRLLCHPKNRKVCNNPNNESSFRFLSSLLSWCQLVVCSNNTCCHSHHSQYMPVVGSLLGHIDHNPSLPRNRVDNHSSTNSRRIRKRWRRPKGGKLRRNSSCNQDFRFN